MAVLNIAAQMKLNFTIVRRAGCVVTVDTQEHTFDTTATLDDVRRVAAEKVTDADFTLGFMDEDKDFVVIDTQEDWVERLRLHNESADAEGDSTVNVMVRIANDAAREPQHEQDGEAVVGATDDGQPCTARFAMWHHMMMMMKGGKYGRGKGMGKGAKRGRTCFERGSKAEADTDTSDDSEASCKRMKKMDGKGWKGCFGKMGGKGCFKGMKGGFEFDMPEDFEEHDEEFFPPCGFKGSKKGGKGCFKGMKGGFEYDGEIDMDDEDAEGELPPCPPEPAWKGGKGAFMMMMKGMKGACKGMKGMKGGKMGKMHHDVAASSDEKDIFDAIRRACAGKGCGKHGMHGKGMKGACFPMHHHAGHHMRGAAF